MANQVLLKKSSVAAKVPLITDLAFGELALNYTDGKLYFKNASNVIKSFTIDDSVVTLTGTQTLTNKTLSSAILTGTLTAGGGVGTAGQVLSTTGTGVQWITAGTGLAVNISTTAPASPSAGNIWWSSDLGKLKIYYNDGNTSQWVDASTGTVGATGLAATIAAGTTTTGLAGTSASVTNVGTSGAAIFNFTIPRGDIGIAATIAAGTTTTTAPGTSAAVTNSGTASAATFNFTIPRGATVALNATPVVVVTPNVNPSISNTGTSGDSIYQFSLPRAATSTLGTVTTGIAGSSASITNTGTSGDSVFNFTIPRGDTGATGPTGPSGPKSALLQFPTTADTKNILFYTTAAATISKIVSVLPAGVTPSVSFNIRYGGDISLAGTVVTTAVITTTSITTATATTTFSSATIAAGSFVWLEVTAVSGTVPALSVTLEF